MISLADFFDAASRSHSDVILLPAIHRVSGNDFVFQQDSAPAHRARATVELLRQKTPNFIAPNLCLQTAQISVLWITRSGLSCSIVSTVDKVINNYSGRQPEDNFVQGSTIITF